TCGMCHSEVVEQYRASVHGRALANGITQAPLCTDCHGEHKIIKHTNEASPVNAAHIRDTCASCHGVHNILPSSDPKSTINPKNLPKTCGQCHPGAGTRFAISQVHVAEG